MRSRWDMQDSPAGSADHELLDAQHPAEAPARPQSVRCDARVAAAEDGSVFTLVIDELHMYRGTQGSEVAYLLRNLFDRLDLIRRPEKLRVLATSASLEQERDQRVHRGILRPADRALRHLAGRAGRATVRARGSERRTLIGSRAVRRRWTTPRPRPLATELGLTAGARPSVCRSDGRPAASSIDDVGATLLPARRGTKAREEAVYGLVDAVGRGGRPGPRAPRSCGPCSASGPAQTPTAWLATTEKRRNIGRLYDQPRYHCDDCGGRVLELLYCETCGDVFLGGYYTKDPDGGSWQLFPDSPDLEGIPERARLGRDATTYMLYWPQRDDPAVPTTNPHWNRGNYHFALPQVEVRPHVGHRREPGAGIHRLDVPRHWAGMARIPTTLRLDQINPMPVYLSELRRRLGALQVRPPGTRGRGSAADPLVDPQHGHGLREGQPGRRRPVASAHGRTVASSCSSPTAGSMPRSCPPDWRSRITATSCRQLLVSADARGAWMLAHE